MHEDICYTHHRGNPESNAAFQSTHFSDIREACYIFVESKGDYGTTADEANIWFQEQYPNGTSTIAARFSELKNAGRIVWNGKRRKTHTGRMARVMVASQFAKPYCPPQTFYCDGGCKGNHLPDESKRSMRAVVCDAAGKMLVDQPFEGGGTNNQAELWSVVECLQYAKEHGISVIRVLVDSTNCIKWVEGKMSEDQLKLKRVKNLVTALDRLRAVVEMSIEWVPREKNLAGVYLESNKVSMGPEDDASPGVDSISKGSGTPTEGWV